jgi:hypothetical protein
MSEKNWEDLWVEKVIKRHFRYIGFRIYTGFDTETRQWHRSLRFQWLNKIDKKIIEWKINKPDWWLE